MVEIAASVTIALGIALCGAGALLGFGLGRRFTSKAADPTDDKAREAEREPARAPANLGQFQAREHRRHDCALTPEQRRDLFAELPSLSELHEQAQAIRYDARIWEDHELCREIRAADPLAAHVLTHYERSLEGLN